MIQVYKKQIPALNGGLRGGLNGWFGKLVQRLCQGALSLVAQFPIVGAVFQNELTQLRTWINDSSNFQWRGGGDYEPTPSEATILENWATTKLNPFYKTMVEQLSSAFANANINVQLQLINNVVLKMCVTKQYFANNETTGLSSDAVLSRMELINKIFEPVEGLIAKSVAEYGMVLKLTPYNFNFTTATMGDFAPLFGRVSGGMIFNCNKYVATGTPNVEPPKPTKPTMPTVTTVKPTTPIVTIKPTTPTTPTTPVSPTAPVNPVSSINPPPPPSPVTPVAEKKGFPMVVKVGTGIGLIWLASLLFGDDDKKKKE